MKPLEKQSLDKNIMSSKILIDDSLDNRAISKAELKKLEDAKEFLKKHPIPEGFKMVTDSKPILRYDPALDNLPIPKRALEKTEEARKFLEKHPIPEHLLRK